MKISYGLLLLVFSPFCLAETVIVQMKDEFDRNLPKKTMGKWSKFTSYSSRYFNKLYYFESEKKLTEKDINYLERFTSIAKVERISEISLMSVDPAEISTAKANDPYYVYQWGLDFQGQKVWNELNDLENYLVPGTSEADVNIKNPDQLERMFKKDVVVAIIDTGVNYDHPDLKNNIAINEVECEKNADGSYSIPFGVRESRDDNEYAGDCKGWNFTGRKRGGTNRPEDGVGHGTHLAGIIAAERNNEIGISGVSNRIKILPIKVLSNKAEDSQALGTSDRLTKAILYAVQMKVDVINLSLGWPLSFDKEHLSNAVKEALAANITVVAAAGNNDHSEPIMPCGYEGVICVGSSDPDKNMSDFSNFGAHVDVLAPGNNILSTYPTAETPLFFDINGYEFKSGTSQSAPFVSALVASIKGVFPGISENEVKARIYGGSAQPFVTEKKFANGNIIHFENALNFTGKILKPQFKGFNRVKVNKQNKTFSFSISFSDYETAVDSAQISIISPKELILDQTEFRLTGDTKTIELKGKLAHLDVNLLQKMSLVAKYAGKSERYNFEKRFYTEFSDHEKAKAYMIKGGSPKLLMNLSTVHYMHVPYDFPFYYTQDKKKDGIILSLFTKKQDAIANLGTTKIAKATQILSVHRLDANLDGKADILIRSLIKRDKEGGEVDEEGNVEQEQTIMYSYLTEELKPLFSKALNHSHMILNFEGVILQNLNDFSFGHVEFKGYGRILMPVYMFYGEQPEADTNANPFARLRRRAFSAKIYYYEPAIQDDGTVDLITRTMNDNKFVDSLKRKIGFRPFEQIFMVKFLKQNFTDIKQGKFSILISHESERKLPRSYMITVTDLVKRQWNIKKMQTDDLNLSEFSNERGYDLSQDRLFRHMVENKIIGYSRTSKTGWESYIQNQDRLDYVSIEQTDIHDPLEYPIKTYYDGERIFRLFLTPSRIYTEVSDKSGVRKLSYPVHVSSFLPGLLFKEQHYPISFTNKGKNYPALYVDSTQIASSNIYLITIDGHKIVAPVRFNVNIPPRCKALNPVIIEGYKYEYSIQCFKQDKTSELIYIPLEVE